MSGTGFISGKSPGSHNDDFENPLVMNISRMSEMELDKEFEKMLDNMNLSDLKKEPLRRLGPHKKREMLTMHNKTNTRASVSIKHEFLTSSNSQFYPPPQVHVMLHINFAAEPL